MQKNFDLTPPPAWVTDAIFYQIFPERFENGDQSNDPPNVEQWGGVPKPGNYFGGDLQGIINRIEYLKELGINALYLNPIFAANSNHKYNTKDYLVIDPSFGTNQTFEQLLDVCHKNNIRVVIDGVFNHVGTAHAAFQGVMEKGRDSQYASWFNIYSYPVVMKPKPNYECWWGHAALPKLMVQNPDVKKYIFEVTKFWTEKGIDGWRLDVPNECPHEFWKEWRTLVKSINSECYITGEIWQDASEWLRGDEFDAVMNYRFRSACLDYFGTDTITAQQFTEQLKHVRNSYSLEINFAMQNLLGSHDTERYITLCRNELWRVKLSMMFQLAYLGAPMIYYGDEIGMEGGKDPDCRRTMIWNRKLWNKELFDYVKDLIQLRVSSEALRKGDVTFLLDDIKSNIVVFRRQYQNSAVIIAINKSTRKKKIKIPTDMTAAHWEEFRGSTIVPDNKGILSTEIPARSGKIFMSK